MFHRRKRSVLLLGCLLIAASILLGCGTPADSGASANVQDVQSSALRSVGYDAGSQTLAITFASGSTYEYNGVPRNVYEELMSAPSKGRYFNAHIRDQYSYRRTR